MISSKSRGSVSAFGSIMILVVLLVYTTFSLRLNSIHQFFHAEKITELHSVEKESDPCHKNIYHQQKESGCEHKSHITENTKCPVCEHSSSSKEIVPSQFKVEGQVHDLTFTSFYREADFEFAHHSHSGRGPPLV